MASALKSEGYRLLVASSTEEALAIADAHQGPIDLLLTDAVMPGRSGLDLAKELNQTMPQVAVLFMSGYPERVLPANGRAVPAASLPRMMG